MRCYLKSKKCILYVHPFVSNRQGFFFSVYTFLSLISKVYFLCVNETIVGWSLICRMSSRQRLPTQRENSNKRGVIDNSIDIIMIAGARVMGGGGFFSYKLSVINSIFNKKKCLLIKILL